MAKEKLSKFSEVLSQLRKERGISQKKAATDLGISQALLSHYEKGIRECGLDFVIKCSEYYNVTTDYLLGVSDNRNGVSADYFDSEVENESLAVLMQATKQLFDMAVAVSSGSNARRFVYDYYMLALYRGALTLAKAGAIPKELFRIDYTVARELAAAAIAVEDAKFALIEDRSRTGKDDTDYSAITSLVEQAEGFILDNYIME
ncbi:MAG: helix-turn-helix transcriptional regulator [Eubacterium sp.]|nr:helix-turn-helix transcriptional regulator [Eubacterium sp.]